MRGGYSPALAIVALYFHYIVCSGLVVAVEMLSFPAGRRRHHRDAGEGRLHPGAGHRGVLPHRRIAQRQRRHRRRRGALLAPSFKRPCHPFAMTWMPRCTCCCGCCIQQTSSTAGARVAAGGLVWGVCCLRVETHILPAAQLAAALKADELIPMDGLRFLLLLLTCPGFQCGCNLNQHLQLLRSWRRR